MKDSMRASLPFDELRGVAVPSLWAWSSAEAWSSLWPMAVSVVLIEIAPAFPAWVVGQERTQEHTGR